MTAARRRASISVGTSGYAYPHWKDLLYANVPARAWLERYAQSFDTVELDGTFYRLPTAASVDRWAEATPPGFVFSCKGSRFLTHMKRLRAEPESIDRYFSVILRLGAKLGPILWQLPPQMASPDPARLAAFLEMLPRRARCAVEFRHAAWYRDDICNLLDAHGVAVCEHDLLPIAPPRVTGGFRYLRFHGTRAPYQGRYGRRALEPAADSLLHWQKKGGSAFVYFNNDVHGDALYDAVELSRLLGVEPRLVLPRRPLGRRPGSRALPPLAPWARSAPQRPWSYALP